MVDQKAPNRNGTEETEALPANHIQLATGVVLEVVEASIFAIQKVQSRLAKEEPQPPMVTSSDEAHQEPNESDPEYARQIAEWKANLVEKSYEVAVATGTKIVTLPDGFPNVESTEWSETLAVFGVEVAETGPLRYADWIKYEAAKGPSDFARLLKAVMTGIGTTEQEVAEAIATFQGVASGGGSDEAGSP